MDFSTNYIIMFIIVAVVFAVAVISLFHVSDLSLWVERPSGAKNEKSSVCRMENGYMHWTFKMNDR